MIKKTLLILSLLFLTPVLAQAQSVPEAGDLIQAEGSDAVYYLGSDNKRYVFPNEKTYKTWYEDFSQVVLISPEQLASYQIGGNITYRPGTRLVKITSDPKTYAVEPGGVLRWITTEEVASGLYGDNWASLIDDVADVYFINYKLADNPLDSLQHPIGSLISYPDSSDIFIISLENNILVARKINSLADNNYQAQYVLNIPSSLTYPNGTPVTGPEENLVDLLADQVSQPTVLPEEPAEPTALPELAPGSLFVDSRSLSIGDGSLDKPYRTINQGLANLSAGQTLYIRGGVNGSQLAYNEALSIISGGAFDKPKTIKAFPGEKVNIDLSTTLIINSHWLVFEDLIFDWHNSANDAIHIGGSDISFKNVEFSQSQGDGVVFLAGAENNTLTESRVHNFGLDCVEIRSITKNITISNSEIFDCTNDAVEIQAAVAQDLSRMPSDIIINGNTFSAGATGGFRGINVLGTISTTISNNIFDQFLTDAIEITDLSQNVSVTSNKISSSVDAIEIKSINGYTPRNIDVFNNIIYGIIGPYALYFNGVDSLRVVHNTIVNITSSPFKVGTTGITSGQIRNNLISNSGANQIEKQAQKAVVSNNGWFNGASESGLGGSHNFQGDDPKFTDSVNDNFHLLPDSPAVDAGIELNYIVSDFAGNSRLVGPAPDLGAYEVQ